MFSILAGILAYFYDLIPNYAIAISLLTVVVMLVLTPLTLKGTRSMLAMQKLQPEMKRLQDQHKGDKQAQNEALMAFYKEHKINPLAGCLPTLLQLPVFFIMLRVIRGLATTKRVGGTVIAKPSYIGHDTALYHALQKAHGKMVSFGVDFAATPRKAGAGAVVIYLIIGLVVLTGYYQMRQMQSRTSQQQINPQMQTMTKIMPLFSGLIGLQLAGGVSLYFLVSNLFRIAQQSLMYRFDPALASHMAETREVRSRPAVAQPKPQPQERKSLLGGLFGGGAAGNGNGSDNGNGKSNGTNKPNSANPGGPKYSSGRVTPPQGGRPKNQSRKRSKRKR